MRIALGGLCQESHSFSPAPAGTAEFESGVLVRGAALVEALGGLNHEIAGALDALSGHEVMPLLYGATGASGMPLRKACCEALQTEIVDRLRAALPVDGVVLAMHGAMAAEHQDDATGALLSAVRDLVGPRVRVVASLDLHANVTRKMAAAADALVGYRTAPHVDQADTGRRAGKVLLRVLSGARPVTALRQIPMILPAENGRTTDGPYAEVMRQVEALAGRKGILAASAFSVQPWLDLPEVGCSVVVVADGDGRLASDEADRLADAFWRRRHAFAPDLVPVEAALTRALSSSEGPWIFSDSADAPSSGAPGDGTALLRAVVARAAFAPVLLNVVDPPAVAAAFAAGVGSEVDVAVGGRMAPEFGGSVRLRARVRTLADGVFRNKGPGARGVAFRMGKTAVLVAGGLHLVTMERPVIQWDPELYRSVGLDPAAARVVGVKSPAAFRAAYGPLAAHIVNLDLPGVCSPNLRRFPWKRVRRPIYPLDDIETWTASEHRPERESPGEPDAGRPPS